MDTGKPFRKPLSATGTRIGANRLLDTGMGKLPPQALDMEEAVLGALMIEKDALTTVIDILKPPSFYKDAHREIYQAILDLFAQSQPVDLLTVTQRLRATGKLEMAGGPFYITELTSKVNSAANVEYHARVISEQAIKRELISIASDIQRDAFEDTTDVFQLLDRTEQNLFNISESNIRKNVADMRSLMQLAIKELEAKKDHKDGLTGVATGFSALDRITSGWQKSDLIILAARPGMGKCLGKGTKVLMYNGSLKKVEDVVIGDQLMGDDSTPRRVLSIARGRENMYWVRQNKGMDYRVNESHILSLKRSRNEGNHRNGAVLNISVRDYLTKSGKFKSNYKGYKVGVEFPSQELPVDPYFLGIWLGDGSSNNCRITTQDGEIVTYLREYATLLELQLTEEICETRCNTYGITRGSRGGAVTAFSLQDELRQLNLLGNKHIPQNYLINATANRLTLLAGLIDSDGHYNIISNGYEIAQKNERLARQIKFLCDSLGFRTSLKRKRASISSRGFECEVFRVRFYGDVDKIPVKLPRKKALSWKSPVDWRLTGIQVEFDREDDYYGFEIDGNRLFLLEDMTVTHNTAFVVSAMRNASVDFGHPVAIFSLEMSSVQLVNRLISAEAELESEKIKKGNLAQYEWEQLHYKIRNLESAPIFIDDTPALSILELRAKCRRLKSQHDIQLVIIDYLQLMSGDSSGRGGSGNREQEIASISRALKNIAKELDIPVIALSQLSRAVETRGGEKKPQLSDLRESGCLTGDTLILDAVTGKRIPIKELAERPVQTPLQVLATNERFRVADYPMTKVFYSGKKQVYELKTRTGRTIKASANHPFLRLDGWKRLDELQPGDRLATPRQIRVENPVNPMSEDELILLAHLTGDGCVLPRQPVHYTSADLENIEIVGRAAKRLFGIEGRIVKQENWFHLYLPAPYHLTHGVKHPITVWYERLGIERVRSYNKRLPDALFECDDERIALFLRHLWATDGNVSWKILSGRKDAVAIYYATSSKILAEQVQHLLLRLPVQSVLKTVSSKKGYRNMYHVPVMGTANQLKFLQKVGCTGQRGKCIPEMLEALAAIEENVNYDVIPKEAWLLLIAPAKEPMGVSWRNFTAQMQMSYCGSTLFKHEISRERMSRIVGVLPNEFLRSLAQSDVYWDEIISITELGMEDVYDATVPGVHNFVANDFIVHNSIEQDADMVIFLYRPEYYNITQDESGNPTTNMGEVIIAKHRNGSLDTVQLRFIGKYTKFADMDAGNIPAFGSFPDSSGIPSEFDQSPGTITLGSKINTGLSPNNAPNLPPDDAPPF